MWVTIGNREMVDPDGASGHNLWLMGRRTVVGVVIGVEWVMVAVWKEKGVAVEDFLNGRLCEIRVIQNVMPLCTLASTTNVG